MTTAASAAPQTALDHLDWDYVEFYVGNAKQAAHFYRTAFGFEQIAYAGPETGSRDRVSYVLEQNRLRFVITSSLQPDDEITRHAALHGDGVRDVALGVADAAAAFRLAVERGARPVREPWTRSDEFGSATLASIAAYGDTIHTFVERNGYRGPFLPGFVEQRIPAGSQQYPALHHIDHCVGNVGWHEMDVWAGYYARVFNFTPLISFDDADISTEYTALRSKVMSDARRAIKFPINEPAQGLKKSQIEEYLDFYRGAGVQHLALHTSDIVSTIRALRANGVEFLEAPDAYYDQLDERVGKIDEAIDVLRELRILVDRDDRGYMLQLFTKPLQDRPTLFFEIIQRKGSLSFGKGNFKALFVAIEQEQAKRGTL
ncbi:4-hydroxyphenylpyruvate dioxygenase [bacterium]|nr:MAG: 4-hydroxyphenylpyruvate dioxygenase [bacterium]